MLNLRNLDWQDGRDNDGGIQAKFFYIPYNDILTWPTINPNPTEFAQKVVLVGNFVLKPGKSWKTGYCTMEKGMLKTTMVGETDGKSGESVVEFTHPGNEDYLLGFIEYFKNTSMVVMIQELDKTDYRVIGNKSLPAKLDSAEVTTGDAVKNLKHAKMGFKSVGRIAQIYRGFVQLDTELVLSIDFAGGSLEYTGLGNNIYTIPVDTVNANFFVWQNGRTLHKVTVTAGTLPTGLVASIVSGGKIGVIGTPTVPGIYPFTLRGQITDDGTETGTVLYSADIQISIQVLP